MYSLLYNYVKSHDDWEWWVYGVLSRELAESSPYLEALRRKDVEVLFCYESHDELVLMQLKAFDKFTLTSVEKEMRQDKEAEDLSGLGNYLHVQVKQVYLEN